MPNYTRPEPAIPPAWSGDSNQGLPGAVAVRSGWWRSFGSAELSALVERSLAANYNLQGAIARIDEARGTAQIAGAPLYPALSLNGTLDRSNGKGTDLKTSRTQNAVRPRDLRKRLLGQEPRHCGIRECAGDRQPVDSDTVAMTLAASVADTYFQMLSLQERIRLAKTIALDAARVLSLIEARQSVGTATELDVEQQRNAVATFNAAVPFAATAVGAEPAPARDPGRRRPGKFRRRRTQPERSVRSRGCRPTCRPSVLRQRPDIRAAEARLVAANFSVGAARAAFYPSLNLTAAGGIASPSLSHFFPLAKGLSDLGGTLLQPLFSGGQLEGQLQLNRAQVVELTATYRQSVIAALQDVEDSLTRGRAAQGLWNRPTRRGGRFRAQRRAPHRRAVPTRDRRFLDCADRGADAVPIRGCAASGTSAAPAGGGGSVPRAGRWVRCADTGATADGDHPALAAN